MFHPREDRKNDRCLGLPERKTIVYPCLVMGRGAIPKRGKVNGTAVPWLCVVSLEKR